MVYYTETRVWEDKSDKIQGTRTIITERSLFGWNVTKRVRG
jgi:hypothetical protein